MPDYSSRPQCYSCSCASGRCPSACASACDGGPTSPQGAFAGGACRELKWLSPGINVIGDAGIAALSTALEKGALPNLTHLLLYNNSIGDEGLKALMAACSGRLSKLERIDLERNNISDEGVEAIADALDKGELPSLKDLRLPQQTENFSRLIAACVNRSFLLLRTRGIAIGGFLLNGSAPNFRDIAQFAAGFAV